jgi:predicted TIM-barrel fold metal-dependent hydrolase
MIIDAHLHCRFGRIDVGELGREAERILCEFEKVGIETSCLMNSGNYVSFYYDEQILREQADCLSKMVEMFPGKFYALLRLNALIAPESLIEVMDEYIVNGPLTGVKLTIQANARDERFDRIAPFMEKHDIPVLWHSWYKTTCKYAYESDPSDIACFARKFPGVRILMAHLTGCGRRGVQDIKDCPNVVIDTSGSQPFDGYLEYALTELGPDRILFGSDYPCRDIPAQLGRIQAVDLSSEDSEKILRSNALKFYERKGK